LIACVLLAAVRAAYAYPGDEVYARPGVLVDIGGRKLNLYCTGWGAPTIVLESGLGGRASAWAQVQPLIAAHHRRVCSYDRAGYGFSDPDAKPRTASRIADDLYVALRKAHLHGPYVLVAATYGAFPVRLLAGRHQKAIAGLVLLNPSPEDEELTPASSTVERIDSAGLNSAKTCLESAKRGALAALTPERERCVGAANPALSSELNARRLDLLSKPATWGAIVSEWSNIVHSAAQVKAARGSRYEFALTVISASEEPPFNGSDEDVRAMHQTWLNWDKWQHDIAALSANSRLLHTKGSGRVVESSDPAMVAAAIEETIARSKPV